ncbi:hypothetical protein MLD38_014112 [Melastoma candidum]|uniref:Uncharacterized protein n=1 Tax=Melastoma candidum TaxID=119954 RepID=A0ACB9RD14_9MYRT|nr:hypothetical protein MLD38_014112 [Melastoma candidum]
MASRLCDACKSSASSIFCRADSAFLCLPCDSDIHAANKLASRHARIVLCQVCEQCPAVVTCKADAASLCASCDRDIHSANPLARKHLRVPVVPFFDSASFFRKSAGGDGCLGGADEEGIGKEEEEEAESWIVMDDAKGCGGGCEEEGVGIGEVKFEVADEEEEEEDALDGVVPVGNVCMFGADGEVVGYGVGGKGFGYGFGYGYEGEFSYAPGHCFNPSVSSSSLDVGIVPDGGSVLTEVSRPATSGVETVSQPVVALSPVDREARVLRYREKRKNRKFEKTIRYASRKAYAETRPRIKGRFAKRSDIQAEAERLFGFGVVPSF